MGLGDVIRRLTLGVAGVVVCLLGDIGILTSVPDPPNKGFYCGLAI